jgi:hypothetical protein
MTSADVTRRELVLGSQDSITGWYAPTYNETTIPVIIRPRGSSLTIGGFGYYAKYPETIFIADVIYEGDQIVDAQGATYLIRLAEQEWALNNFVGYVCDAERLPMHVDRATSSGTWHLDSTDVLTSLQYLNKRVLDTYLSASNLKKDGGASASYITEFANPDYPLIKVFQTKAVDLIFSIGRGTSEPLMTRDKKPYAWKETVTILLNTINKSGITGANLLEQAEQEVRRIYESNPTATGYTVRRIQAGKETTQNFASTILYGLELTITYYRLDTNYTATYPKLSFNNGVIFDGDDLSAFETCATFNFLSSGYIDAVPSDINKPVTCSGAYIGLLRSYDNSGRNWVISNQTSFTISGGDTFTVDTGTGVGTRAAWGTVSITLNSIEDDYYDLYVDATSRMSLGEIFLVNLDAVNLSSTLYPKIRYRYAVDGTAMAGIKLVFNDASTQTILSNGTATTLVVGTALINTAKTIEFIEISNSGGVGHVFCDFLQVYAGDFVFPNVESVKPSPPIRDASLEVPGMIGTTLQPMGAPSATVDIKCCLSMGNWQTPNTSFAIPGSIFWTISQNLAQGQLWHWLDCGDFAMRVRYKGQTPAFSYEPDLDTVNLTFIEGGSGSRNTETEAERFNLT